MRLTPSEVRTVAYLLGSYLHMSNRRSWHIPPSVAALADRLTGVSATRHETGCSATTPEQSEGVKNCVGTRLAAQRLGWTERKVQRHAEQLGGVLVGSRWVFNADLITAHAKENQ